ncbi:uncharacterized protein V1518DRAFT_213602 [Limtongia smithiae]|uniref:uncharacterized protein n=1 Tax=Limtongia smithiae TaxID=1125753 RepID=UPI0034CD9160
MTVNMLVMPRRIMLGLQTLIALSLASILLFCFSRNLADLGVPSLFDDQFSDYNFYAGKKGGTGIIASLNEADMHRSMFKSQNDDERMAGFKHLNKCFASSGAISADSAGSSADAAQQLKSKEAGASFAARVSRGVPPCAEKTVLLDSLSGGGRIGRDMPYFSSGPCGLWWYSTTDLCSVLARFSGVLFIGDDVLGSVFSALMVLLREDTLYGAVKEWGFTGGDQYFGPGEAQCYCEIPFLSPQSCPHARVTSSREVLENARATSSPLRCPGAGALLDIEFIEAPSYPIDAGTLADIAHAVRRNEERFFDKRPFAVIYGHSGYSTAVGGGGGRRKASPTAFNADVAIAWLEQVSAVVGKATPGIVEGMVPLYELFVTPGATGPGVGAGGTPGSSVQDVVRPPSASATEEEAAAASVAAAAAAAAQDNLAASGLRMSRAFDDMMRKRTRQHWLSMDSLGTWNATVQTTFSRDGVHQGLPTNVLKAMMVANWLELTNIGWM